MKKFLSSYYGIIISLIIFFIELIGSFTNKELIIEGFLSVIILIGISVLNICILNKIKNNMKLNKIIVCFSIILMIWAFILEKGVITIFEIINIFTLLIINFKKSIFMKIILVIYTIISIPCILFICMIAPIAMVLPNEEIYDETYMHYEDNYESFEASAGAMDSIHYYIGKSYKIIDMGKILKITYISERKEVDINEYNKFVKEHRK